MLCCWVAFVTSSSKASTVKYAETTQVSRYILFFLYALCNKYASLVNNDVELEHFQKILTIGGYSKRR